MAEARLEAMRRGIPAARSLPLLATLARKAAESIALEFLDGTSVRVTVRPC